MHACAFTLIVLLEWHDPAIPPEALLLEPTVIDCRLKICSFDGWRKKKAARGKASQQG
jgi:hypothetical protein